MKITIDRNEGGVHMTAEREPMPPERFAALCKLAGFAIGGAMLVALGYLLGTWGIFWPLLVLVLAGVGKLIKGGFID